MIGVLKQVFERGDIVFNARRIEFTNGEVHEPHTVHIVTPGTIAYFNVNYRDYAVVMEIKVGGRTFAAPNHECGYTENYLRSYMEVKGGYQYDLFLSWMKGQTCGVDKGEKIFYAHDVLRYLTKGGVMAEVVD